MGSRPGLTAGHLKGNFNLCLVYPEWAAKIWLSMFAGESLDSFPLLNVRNAFEKKKALFKVLVLVSLKGWQLELSGTSKKGSCVLMNVPGVISCVKLQV